MTTRDENYFTEKYGMTRTHSDVVHAATIVKPGKTLDLGCGNGVLAIASALRARIAPAEHRISHGHIVPLSGEANRRAVALRVERHPAI